jgi:NADH-quinone oxidoreductase subunit H
VRLPFHLLGDADVGLLWALALGWLSTVLLVLSREDRFGEGHGIEACGRGLLQQLPLLLLACSVVLTGGALHPLRRGGLRVATLVEAQGGWAGCRWVGLFQPLALVVWLACASLAQPGDRARTTVMGQVQALSQALLAAALFMGGWQGPLVQRFAWLGLAYTALKVGVVVFVWTWVRASLPRAGLRVSVRNARGVWVPLAMVNLALTACIVPLVGVT